jgi:hypothetical protein
MNALDAKQLIRRLIDEEFSSVYRFVRRIPSTHVWQTLAYLDTLDVKERGTLFDLWAERGSAMLTLVGYGQQSGFLQHPAYQRYTNAVCGPSAWTYADPSYVRSIIEAQAQIPADWGPAEPPDLGLLSMEAVDNAPSPKAVRAPEIRREVKGRFRDRFRIQPANKGGGVWAYAGDCDGRAFTLTIDYGGFDKFRYGVVASQSTRMSGPYGVSWEALLGFGLGGWDFVRAHNLNASVSLLGEVIEKLVSLLEEADAQRD